MHAEAIVVGGGLGGLLAALELDRRGLDVLLLDASDLPGGIARTIERDGHRMEPAVGSLSLPGPHLGPILDHAGVATTPVPAATVRYIHVNGTLHPVGPGPGLLTSRLLTAQAKLRAVGEPFVTTTTHDEESLVAFLVRRFGEGAGRLVAHTMASGVFAGDPHRLSATDAFPRLAELEALGGSVLKGAVQVRRSADRRRPATHVPIGGTSAMVDRLADSLADRAVFGRRVERVERSGGGWLVHAGDEFETPHVVLAVGPAAVADLLPPIDVGSGPHHAAVDVVWLGGPRNGFPVPAGFGYITGLDGAHLTRGCIFESSLTPSSAPAGASLVKAIAGGALNPGFVDMEPDDVVAQVADEVAVALGHELDVTFQHVVRHRPGIPQYEVGHGAWVDSLEQQLEPGLHLAGWSYRGIGVARLAAEAARIADRVTT